MNTNRKRSLTETSDSGAAEGPSSPPKKRRTFKMTENGKVKDFVSTAYRFIFGA